MMELISAFHYLCGCLWEWNSRSNVWLLKVVNSRLRHHFDNLCTDENKTVRNSDANVTLTAGNVYLYWGHGKTFHVWWGWWLFWLLLSYYCFFWVRSQNFKKRLLASSLLSVRPSVCPHGTTRLHLDGVSWNLSVSLKSVEKNQVSLKSGKNNGHFTWRAIYIFDHTSINS
jgi:hypothetical protein